MEQAKYFNHHIKPPKSFFKEGASYFSEVIFKKKNELIKPSSRKSRYKYVETLNIRSNTNFRQFFDIIYLQRFATTSKKIEHQTWCFTRRIELENNIPIEIIESSLTNLIIWENEQEKRFINRNLSGLGWSYDGCWSKQDYAKLFKKSELKYTNVWVNGYLDQERISRAYKYRKIFEILVALRNDRVPIEIFNKSADMRILTLSFLKKNKALIKQNLSFDDIYFEIPVISHYYPLNKENIDKIKYRNLSRREIESIIKYELENNIKPRKLLRYLDKQSKSIYFYKDYIGNLKELDMFEHKWSVLFPKNLEYSHDQMLKKVSEQKEAKRLLEIGKLEKKYIINLKELKKLELQDDEYSILIPDTLNDIYYEGKKLQHCVWSGNYIKNHAELNSLILFVRKTSDLNKPFFTLEFNPERNEIIQLHGFRNENKEYPEGMEAFENRNKILDFATKNLINDQYKNIVNSTMSKLKNKGRTLNADI